MVINIAMVLKLGFYPPPPPALIKLPHPFKGQEKGRDSNAISRFEGGVQGGCFYQISLGKVACSLLDLWGVR